MLLPPLLMEPMGPALRAGDDKLGVKLLVTKSQMLPGPSLSSNDKGWNMDVATGKLGQMPGQPCPTGLNTAAHKGGGSVQRSWGHTQSWMQELACRQRDSHKGTFAQWQRPRRSPSWDSALTPEESIREEIGAYQGSYWPQRGIQGSAGELRVLGRDLGLTQVSAGPGKELGAHPGSCELESSSSVLWALPGEAAVAVGAS